MTPSVALHEEIKEKNRSDGAPAQAQSEDESTLKHADGADGLEGRRAQQGR